MKHMISAGVLGLVTTLALPAPGLAATRTLTFEGDFIDLLDDDVSVLQEEQGFRFSTSSFYPSGSLTLTDDVGPLESRIEGAGAAPSRRSRLTFLPLRRSTGPASARRLTVGTRLPTRLGPWAVAARFP